MNLRLAFLIFAYSAMPACITDTAEMPERPESFAEVRDLNHEPEFNVYVPDNYNPSSPAGRMVYVSPIESGEMPDMWKEVLDRRNLIWVSVDHSGNTVPRNRRIAEARLSAAFILQNYVVDPQRIYISGMSGGAQIASIVASISPGLFRGGVFLCGVNPWSEGDADPWAENPPENFERMAENRYVFVSGTEDFKLAAVARVYRIYKRAGVDSSKLIVIDGMGHELPDAETYDRALGFLDIGMAVSEKPVHVEAQ